MLAAFTWSDAADLALAFFLIVVGLGLGTALFVLSGTLARLNTFLRGTQEEVLPILHKVGGSVDRVNLQLDKLDQATGSAVDAVDAIDQAVRTVSFGVRRPIERLAGAGSGVSHGLATLRRRRDWRAALTSAREASARRQADLQDELRRRGG